MVTETKTHSPMSHSLILTERKKMSVSGVEDVESFDDTEIRMHTVQGSLRILGSDLHVDKLDLASGEVAVTGLISTLDYAEVQQSGSLFSRLFR